MTEISATPEAQLARQGIETLAWQTGKTAVETGAKVREGRSLLERLGLRREVVEKASPTVTELAAKAAEGLGKLATKAGESLRRRGEQRLERGRQWAESQLTSQQKEDEKALDEKAKLSREAQIRATEEKEVSRRVSTETTIIGRENILQEALNRTQETLRRLQERFMGWRARVNTVAGQQMIMRGLDIGNVGEQLLRITEGLREGWDSKKAETLQAIDTQLQPLEERVKAGERIQQSLEDAFTRVVEGGPAAVQAAREVIASLRPEDVAGQEEELRKMIDMLARLAGAGQQPQSPLEQARNY
jgi:myosin heavy subunit